MSKLVGMVYTHAVVVQARLTFFNFSTSPFSDGLRFSQLHSRSEQAMEAV